MKGGYVDDKWVQGCENDAGYAIWHWYLMDVFVYFSHSLVTIPPPCWTNTAHRHGVKVLGTFITEWDEGKATCNEMLATKESAQMYAERLAELATSLGFDGWLINIENEIDEEQIPNLMEYDSVTVSGDLKWQDHLNNKNKPFFDLCDGIFMNYTWKESYPKLSAEVAGDRKYDVYMGIDVFGRGSFGGGQWTIPSSIGNLSHLTNLDLRSNQISGKIPSSIGNLYNLAYLDLSENNIVGEIPSSFGNLNQLTSLNVGLNRLNGSFPIALLNLTELSSLLLYENQFTGTIPHNITSLSKLTFFSASYNAFTGTLPSSLFTIPSMDSVNLSDNQLNGILELGNISSPSKLQVLNVGRNNLRGPIPATLSKFTNLVRLRLSHYNTQGPIDFSIFLHLKRLEDLDLSYLNTTTTIDLNDILSYFKRLSVLVLSGNHVSATNKSPVPVSPLLYQLHLSGCGITEFPEFVRNQNMEWLDISNNKIKGQMPGWLWTLPNLTYLDLSNNTFTGNIPSFICDLRGLSILDLSNNNFSGVIPPCMENLYLKVLSLRQNRLHGGLPENICQFSTTLDVGHNKLTGKLPKSLINSSFLEVLNVESNIINDTFPFWLSSLPQLKILVLRSNAFHGPVHQTSFPELQIIDISHNHFNGSLSSDYFVKWSAMSSLGDNYDQRFDKYMGGSYYHDSMVLMNKENVFSEFIPSSIVDLSHLTFLDLSRNHFSGQIPFAIGNLSHLTNLDLGSNQILGQIPTWIGNLSHLTNLDLGSNQISGQIPSSIGNLYNLAYLDLSWNNIVGEIPSSFGNLNQLTTLYASLNRLNGSLPIALLNLTELSYLELYYNQFTGTIPHNITSLSKLTNFVASFNAFTGTLPSSLLTLPSMDSVDLFDNQLNGNLELGNISSPSKLQVLNVGRNNLRGPIPATLSKFTNLVRLRLSHYNTQGPIDFSIFSHLKRLEDLDLSDLNTTTTIDLNDFLSYFKRLGVLDLSGNHVSVTNKSTISDPSSLYQLYLSGCGITEFPEFARSQNMSRLDISNNKIKGQVPGWLVKLQNMEWLDISNNKIKGQVPGWLWTTLPNLTYLDLSNNNFTGFEKPTTVLVSRLNWFASNNNFTGKIPSFICYLRSVYSLDLSNNNFSGLIPSCLGNLKPSLEYLNLRQNRLHGGLPENIFGNLRTLDIGHNQLTGKLPRTLIRFSSLEVLNVESNFFNDTFPFWLSFLPELKILVLRFNAFHGPIHQTSFPELQIIDISHNHFNGALPSDFFVKWSAMSSLGTVYYHQHDQLDKYMGGSYYHDSMVLMNKGIEMEFVRILKIYTALDFSGNKFEGEIPSSIGLLKELHVLNLSNNAFSGHIPSSMGNLTALESLDVSQNQLSGEIPLELGELSFLSYMNFSHNKLTGLVPGSTQFRRVNCTSFEDNPGLFGPSLDEIPSAIGNLSHLTYLNLRWNQISGKIPSAIGNLSHLTYLNLRWNQISGKIPSSIGNLSHLTYLNLRWNQISGKIPSSIGNLYNLTYLDLSENNIVGEIPSSFGNLNQLTRLDVFLNRLNGSFSIAPLNLTKLSSLLLYYNQFTGTIPHNITSLSKLIIFSASNNAFTGTLPSSLFTLPSMERVDLSDNQLNGILELGNISSPSKLRVLDVNNNNLRGPIPVTISKFTNLVRLRLSQYKTQGPVDFSIFSHLKRLEDLDLSYLNTTTTIDLNDILSYFKRLSVLDLSGNLVSFTNKSPVSDPSLFSELELSGCGITEFPEFVRNQIMSFLDISNNKIKGQVPGWLWTLPNLYYLNLSNNTFTGFQNSTTVSTTVLVSRLSSLTVLASDNNFSGKIPSFICDLRSVYILDLSNNNFSGLIPRCLGNLKRSLLYLNLRHNRLHGGLPENIFESLITLDVGHNQLTGKLPRSLSRFSSLEVLNVESNFFNDTFPFWLSSLPQLKVLVLSSNAFHGPVHHTSFPKLQIIDISHNHFNGALPSHYFVKWSAMSSLGSIYYHPDEMYMGDSYYHDSVVLMNKGLEMKLERILKIYTALDFSGNKFEGEIPRSIGLLKELLVLNLSNNAFTGHIPSSMGNLTALESLDVSQNQLSGEIPQELGELSFLSYMNFSHNKLTGLVPGGTQFLRLNCTSFEDNPGLSGPSLDEICRDIHTPTPHETLESVEEEEEEVLSWIAAVIGLIPGIAFGWVIGYILVSYKPEWFMNPFARNKRRISSTTTH
ncbi:hypothetical protein F2Q69_00038774 [Brassica cretica]|uniref:Mannosyl-glycoprotein endo-beta-N-acetylglucosaminidase n=1 Tax=Brassica cretica TaxID=69181 RepID=A0A8S9SQW0_BRACR|nr:hypothetical protein F2Q69_00038774 [Brassica cretica]